MALFMRGEGVLKLCWTFKLEKVGFKSFCTTCAWKDLTNETKFNQNWQLNNTTQRRNTQDFHMTSNNNF